MEFDFLIRSGLLVDGTGSPPMFGDVGIVGDRITVVGRLDGAVAGHVVDARGMAVAPGFIDVHVHSELARLGGADQFTGIMQGVTTEFMSPDGFAWAPVPAEQMPELRSYLQVFYGDPPLGWNWPTVNDYISLFPGNIPGNLVPQAPHLTIKVAVMGWETRPASAVEIAAMKRLLRQWLDAGAVSLAAGLEYQPGALCETSELVELCKEVAEAGGVYVTHQRGYWVRLEQGSRETFRIGKESGIPVHINHLAVEERTETILAAALEDGVDVSLDMYPYSAACTHLLMMLPDWAQSGGHSATMARLSDSATRHRMRAETAARLAERGDIVLQYVENGTDLEGRSLSALAREAGQEDVDYLFDLLGGHGGRALGVYHWPSRFDHEEILRRTLTHARFMGCSDGIFPGSRPHPRAFGSFARLVGQCVRGGVLSLPQAVRKVTGYPAERFGLKDRGQLRPGMAADVVVFDPATIADNGTYGQGRATPTGVDLVLVNGQLVLERGRPTGRLPGRVIKHAR